MRIDVRRRGCVDLVLVQGCLDLATTPRLRAVLAAHVDQGRVELVVDLHGVRLLSAGAVAVLLSAAESAERGGGCLRAVRAHGTALEVLQIVGADKRLHAYDEPADILDQVQGGPAEAEEVERAGGTSSTDRVDAGPEAGPAAAAWPGSRDITVHSLLSAMARLDAGAPERADLRMQVIEDNLPLARRLAWRFRDRGEPVDDLTQVAMVGLVHAVDGFDPGRGCGFFNYATPTVVGEIRRHFRDKGWQIRVPRRLQELRMQVNRATMELSQRLGMAPSPAQIAHHVGAAEDEVAEAIEAAHLYSLGPLPTAEPGAGDAHGPDRLGDDDPGLEAVENRESVKPLLASLSDRERRILTMRFFADMTQSQIAAELGISQMHVSRLLAQTLRQLRNGLVGAEPRR
jgi:RNA polymerase sigma-B factor